MFFLMLTAGVLLMHVVAVVWTALNTNGLPRPLLSGLCASVLLSAVFVLGLNYARGADGALGAFLTQACYIWLGALLLWFTLAMVVMAAQLALAVFKIHLPGNLGPWVLGAAALLAIISVINASRAPGIRVVELSSPKIKREVKIAQLSDMHLGEGVTLGQMQKLYTKLADYQPDMLVYTGDIFERRANSARFEQIMAALYAPLGSYGALGNHEYYRGVKGNTDAWLRAGITPLLNQSALAGEVNVVGINDIRTSGLSAAQVRGIVAASDTSKYTIALSHTPVFYDEIASAGADLLLSGHTHRGQIWPFSLLVRLQFKHVYGLYKVGDMAHYVTSGAFYWGPKMRFLTSNEVPLFIIKPA